MDVIIDFFNNPFFIIVGGVTTIAAFFTTGYAIFLVIKGVMPVWIRLGYGLSGRKIAIFAKVGYPDLQALLVDSGMFKEKNIIQITDQSIDKARDFSMMLVYFPDMGAEIEEILKIKLDSTSLIVYVPSSFGNIDRETMEKICTKRNSIVTNFKGRLLNDILTSMITTSY